MKNLFDYEENDEAFSSEPHNTWLQIANNIDDQAQELAKEEYGEHESAYYLPKLAEKLKRDMKTFVSWGCVCRDKFKNGRIPASSAVVECELKNIKTKFRDHQTLPMRADEFVEFITLRYIKGSTTLYIAKDNKIQKEKMIKYAKDLEENILASVNSDDIKFDSNIDEVTTLQPEDILKNITLDEDFSLSGKCLKTQLFSSQGRESPKDSGLISLPETPIPCKVRYRLENL